MATNLGSANGTTWNSGNMKPEVDDQTDAGWAQNMADNNSYAVWGKQQKVIDVMASSTSGVNNAEGIAFWRKLPNHDTLFYISRMEHSSGDAGTTKPSLFIDGTTEVALGQVVYSGINGTTLVSSWDQSHLTDGNYYSVRAKCFTDDGVSTGWGLVSFSGWSGTMSGLADGSV